MKRQWDTDPETVEELIARVRQLAEDEFTNRYHRVGGGSCLYDEGTCTNGSVGCIFGQAWPSLTGFRPIAVFLEKLNATEEQIEWCRSVQEDQDNAQTWGASVENADRLYPLECTI